MKYAVAVAWHNEQQRNAFLEAWGIRVIPDWLVLQQDTAKEGGAKTKNKAMKEAIRRGAEYIINIDDDCFPTHEGRRLDSFCEDHVKALQPQSVKLYATVTTPASRGTPFLEENLCVTMEVAASMGFWTEIGDFCAPRQLAHGATHPMQFYQKPITDRYFPLCAMNYAFRAADWQPWCFLIETVGRFDDIWMGYLWQKEAYRRGCCFNLAGPLVRHSRQSNVWKNLRNEAVLLEHNETIWKRIHASKATEYQALRRLLPTFSRVNPT